MKVAEGKSGAAGQGERPSQKAGSLARTAKEPGAKRSLERTTGEVTKRVSLGIKNASVRSWKDLSKKDLVVLFKEMLRVPSRTKLPYVRKYFIEREYIILRHFLAYVRGSGLIPTNCRFRALRGYFRLRRETGRVRPSSRRFKALADPNKAIWVPPQDILYKVRYDLDIYFGDILSGDWDLQRRVDLNLSAKHRAMHERYVLGLSWEDTELFRSYAPRFANGDVVRGVDNVGDLAKRYSEQVDSLFDDMKRNGFVVARNTSGHPKTLPHVHIGRNGEFLFGNNGNHRLAIAKILGLTHIPCWVRGRHLLWQQVREEIAAQAAYGHSASPMGASLAAHPDLADILGLDPLCAR